MVQPAQGLWVSHPRHEQRGCLHPHGDGASWRADRPHSRPAADRADRRRAERAIGGRYCIGYDAGVNRLIRCIAPLALALVLPFATAPAAAERATEWLRRDSLTIVTAQRKVYFQVEVARTAEQQ